MSVPRWCDACTIRPVATKKHRFCYTCEPGGPFTPPPCRGCGSLHNYYSAGMCSRCHKLAPQPVESCRDCHAWGVGRIRDWLCIACFGWRQTAVPPHVAACDVCHHERHLAHDGLCRLCWRVAVDARVRFGPLNAHYANRYGQQLSFADMRKGKVTVPQRERYVPPRRPRPHVESRQLDLFGQRPSWTQIHDLPEPPDARTAAMLNRMCHKHGTDHGWSHNGIVRAQLALRIVQGLHHRPPAQIKTSDVIATTARYGWPARPVQIILTEAGLLHDDRIDAVEPWFATRSQTLPEPMRTELTTWFDVMRHGNPTPPRRHPRTDQVIRSYYGSAAPILAGWVADGHNSLREITRADILAVLPAAPTARASLGVALRSIFAVLKARKIIFTNPIARITIGPSQPRDPMPAELKSLRDALNSDNAACALIAALASFHGLHSRDLRHIHLIDARDGRLHIDGRIVLLADPVRERLATYLDYRNRRWPNTANPHLFIQKLTAGTTAATGHLWILRTLGLTVKALREDRILDEVIATNGDLRRITDLFGLGTQAAARFTHMLNHPDLNQPRGPSSS